MLQPSVCFKRGIDGKHLEMLHDEINVVKVFGTFTLGRTILEFCHGNVGDETVFNSGADDFLTYARNVLDQRNADIRV